MVWLSPLGLEQDAHRLAGLAVWIIVWWLTEALPIAVTALAVPVLGVVLGITTQTEAFSSFAHPLVFLFMGGFFIAQAVTQQKLDQRIALRVLVLPGVKGNPLRSVLALIVLSAFLSMWISNTATTAMLFPIALGVARAIFQDKPFQQGAILLPVAYASSIGGISTPIGSTPNLIAMGLLEENFGVKITFGEWFLKAFPVAALSIVFLCFLTKYRLKGLPNSMDTSFIQERLKGLGKIGHGERNVLFCTALAACLWVLPSVVGLIYGKESSAFDFLSSTFPEATVAIFVSILLFVMKDQKGHSLLSWQEATKIDWGTLLLFGGGLSLGAMAFSTGLAQVIGEGLLDLANQQWFWLVLISVLVSIFFTEICSNTATANMLLPIVLGFAMQANLDHMALGMTVAFGCSLAFMMPIATPPNAIVFGSGLIPLKVMIREGLILNAFCAALLVAYALIV